MIIKKFWYSCTWCDHRGYTDGKEPSKIYGCKNNGGYHEWNFDDEYETDLDEYPSEEYDIS